MGSEQRASVLADDGPEPSSLVDTPISVNLETDELPFQQPHGGPMPVEAAGGGWRTAVGRIDKWPLLSLGVAAVLVVVFAAFISRNGQTLGDDVEEQALVEFDPPAEVDVSDESAGRSTGAAGTGDQTGFSGLVIEPDRLLTAADVDWTATTTVTTDTPPSTDGDSVDRTPSTQPDSGSSTTTVPVAPEEPWVRPIGPGSPDGGDPTVVSAGRVTLEAEGAGDKMRYRFVVYVQGDDGWQRVDRSRWRSKPSWKVDLRRYEGRTIRWTVIGRSGRTFTEESDPLHVRVGDGDGGDGDRGDRDGGGDDEGDDEGDDDDDDD